MNGQDITQVKVSNTGDGYKGTFKVLYPEDSVAGQSGSVQLSLSADVYQYVVFYALCQEVDQYGNLQSYLCDTDPRSACCETPSLTIRIPTSRMTRTSLRPLPAKPPSRSPSMRRALLSPSPALPSRWWARTETPSASTPRRNPVPSLSLSPRWAITPSMSGYPGVSSAGRGAGQAGHREVRGNRRGGL